MAEFNNNKETSINWKEAKLKDYSSFNKEVIVKSNCIYISALNEVNAIKKFKKGQY